MSKLWSKPINHLRAPDLHPLPPRITAQGRERRTYWPVEIQKYSPEKRLQLSMIFQAATDYHWAKNLQKSRGVRTEEDVSRLKDWEREKIGIGKSAWEWFTGTPVGESNLYTFAGICSEFNVNPKRLWAKIRKHPEILRQLGDLRYVEANS